MPDESRGQYSPTLLLVLALIGGGGTSLVGTQLGLTRPDPFTGKMGDELRDGIKSEMAARIKVEDEKFADMKKHIESMMANQVRYWTAMRDHIKQPWHDGAEIRLNQHDNDMARLERLVDDRCGRVPEHTHNQQRNWNQNYPGGK